MGTSMGGAIDYFVSGTNPNTGTTLLTALRAVDSTVDLSDNIPASESQSLVVIGRNAPDSGQTTELADSYLVLGAGRLSESYDINGYIECYRSGPAQKTARDAALALLDALIGWLHRDLTLGGLLLQGRVAHLSSATLSQTQDDDDTRGGDLRLAAIQFTIHAENHYIP